MAGPTVNLQVNRRDIASVLGISMPTVDSWVDRGMPVVTRGGRGVPWAFDVAACVRWQLDHELANAVGESAKDLSLEQAEKRSAIADAILKEIKVAEQMRSVVKVEDVARVWEGRIVASRETFQGIAQRLAPLLVGESDQGRIEQQIAQEIDRALVELAEGTGVPDPEDSDADSDLGDGDGDEGDALD